MEFWEAEDVSQLVGDLMKYHPELIGSHIACIFREKATVMDGVPLVGKISKVSPRSQVLMSEPYDYMIEIGNDVWVTLSAETKRAWVDHILEHAYGEESDKTGEVSWKLRKPNISVFTNIVGRHGLHWMDGLPAVATDPFQKHVRVEAKDPTVRSQTNTKTDTDIDLDLF